MQKQNSFTFEELLSCGRGEMFGEGNAQLPLPPMLMFDRIVSITEEGADMVTGRLSLSWMSSRISGSSIAILKGIR